jgi:hypothetical protein
VRVCGWEVGAGSADVLAWERGMFGRTRQGCRTYLRIAWSRAISLAKEATRCSSFRVPLI